MVSFLPLQNRRVAVETVLALLFGLLLVQALWAPPVLAQGQLMVAPTRVVFEGRERVAQVNIMNTGDETATYRISFVRKRMNETGDFQEIETAQPGERFSDEMIRFSPRQVVLPPGKSQTVRLLLRKPRGVETGEYRSHMLFQHVPEMKEQSVETMAGGKAEGLRIELTPVIGITIPVIVRHGATDVNVALAGLRMIPPTPAEPRRLLGFDIQRYGSRSAYGDLTVYFEPERGEKVVIGRANGVAVYTPNALRKVRLVLEPPPGVSLTKGRIYMTYRERPEEGGALLAEAELVLL